MWIKFLSLIVILFHICAAEVGVLILARGGSKGIRLKNLQKVGGVSLLHRAIFTATAAGLSDITVSTDHPLIALEAIRANATVFRRSSFTATDWAPSIWGAAEIIAARPDITILILMQTTSPFTKPFQLRQALEKLQNPAPYDCVFSVTQSYKLRWKRQNIHYYPVNFDVSNRFRRQDSRGEFIETGAFYFARRSLLEDGKFQNHNCTVLEVAGLESLEVDTYTDLRLANVLLSANLV